MKARAKKIRVVQFGLGAIGCEVVRLLLSRREFELTGVIDTDPRKAGRLLGPVSGIAGAPALRISADAAACLRKARAQAVIHTTGSSVQRNMAQFEAILRAGAHCISSTEELLYPWLRSPAQARRLDALAGRNGVAILGTGVNPGFVMDLLPACLSGICQQVRRLRVERRVDAGRRRLPLQKKIGAGLKPSEFRAAVRAGRMGHVGLAESLMLLARALGWKLDRWSEKIRPRIATRRLQTDHLEVPRGRVAGLHQTAVGWRGGKAVLTLDLEMHIGAADPLDRITVDGTPRFEATIDGGLHGDLATVAALVNAVARVIESGRTGLITVLDLPAPRIGA